MSLQPNELLRKLVLTFEEGDDYEQGFTPRSTRAQLKQYMPYMPTKVVENMLNAPNMRSK